MSEKAYRPEGIHDAFTGADRGPAGPPQPCRPRLGLPSAGCRWTWRQLTSMRVALMLLMLLAVAAVPGLGLPQRAQDPAGVAEYLGDHPTLGAWLDRLGFFDVYSSVWFSAIYILLFVSLVGCIVPRTGAPRRRPRTPAADPVGSAGSPPGRGGRPRRRRSRTTRRPSCAAAALAPAPHLPRRRPRRGRRPVVGVAPSAATCARPATSCSTWRSSGLLVSVALGQLLHYRGQAIVAEGRGFANAVVDYDTFDKGAWFTPSSLDPFSLTLDSFESEFAPDTLAGARLHRARHRDRAGRGARRADHQGQPPARRGRRQDLPAGQRLRARDHGARRRRRDRLRRPGAVPARGHDVHLARRRQGAGRLRRPGADRARRVLAAHRRGRQTARPASVFPQPNNPLLVLEVYRGDLGLDDGVPQNVYRLDKASITPSVDDDGEPVKILVKPGETVDLPDGLGTVSFKDCPATSRSTCGTTRRSPSC